MSDIVDLCKIWDEFFDKIREGSFDEKKIINCLSVLKKVDCNSEFLDKNIVSMIWVIPLFLMWNKERCVEKGADPLIYDRFLDQATDIIIDKLGFPL